VSISILVAFISVVVAIYLLDLIAHHFDLHDEPGGRKQHHSATSLVGGLGIAAGLLTLAFTDTALFNDHKMLFATMLVLMCIGVLDDIRHMDTFARMLVQVGAALSIFYLADIRFLSLGNLMGIGDLGLGPLAILFTCIAVVGGINAVNMMDGLDGLCGSLIVIALAGLILVSSQNVLVLTLSSVTLACVAGFLIYNFQLPWNPHARVFMGDSGSYILGFIIVVLFLLASQGSDKVMAPVTALWLLAIPLLDCVHLVFYRARRGRSPLSDDREHIHYLLTERGFSVEKTVYFLCVAAIASAGVGLALHFLEVSELVSFCLFLAFTTIYFIVVGKIRTFSLASMAPTSGAELK